MKTLSTVSKDTVLEDTGNVIITKSPLIKNLLYSFLLKGMITSIGPECILLQIYHQFETLVVITSSWLVGMKFYPILRDPGSVKESS